MARFNRPSNVTTKTVNLAGGEAYIESPELEFISILLTSFVQDQYYKSAIDVMDRLIDLINSIPDKMFCAQAALYARKEFGMRSISHVVAGEIAKAVKKQEWTKSFFNSVIYRPDDMTEILSYYLSKYGKPIPNSLKKGFASAIQRFDEYQIAKYRGEGKAVSLVDVVNLCHPKATPLLDKLMNGKLKSTETWESKLTKAGQEAKTDDERKEMKADTWRTLIKEKKLGYFALIRNLRNIIDQAPDMIDPAIEMLIDERLIKKSLVLPFRFLTAIENFGTDRRVIQALSKALDISCNNIPELPGKTLVAIDVSGSMQGRPIEIASVFGAALYKAMDSLILLFHGKAWYHVADPSDSTLSIAKAIQGECTNGTDFNQIFRAANQPFDRIIILSDMQAWVGYDVPQRAFGDYKTRTKCNPHVYSFDLAGHGSLQFPEPQIYCLAGFSEKVFDIMALLETDKKALINKIKAVKI